MNVSICIVSYRNINDIVTCLEHVEKSQYSEYNVVICENGGSDHFQHLSEIIPFSLSGGQRVTVLDAGGNVGYAAGVNLCIKASADAECWLLLNPDAALSPSALGHMVERLAVGDVGAVGSVLTGPAGEVRSLGGRWRKHLARAEMIGSGSELALIDEEAIEREQDFISGACMLVGKEILDKVGLMREDYFLYCEEVEWCLRARSFGIQLGFSGKAIVHHAGGSTTGSGVDLRERPRIPVYLNHRNQVLLTKDQFRNWLPVASTCLFFTLLAKYGGRGAWRQLGFALDGWFAGLQGRRGRPAWVA